MAPHEGGFWPEGLDAVPTELVVLITVLLIAGSTVLSLIRRRGVAQPPVSIGLPAGCREARHTRI